MSYPGYGAPPGGAPGYGAPPGGAPGYGAPQGGAPGYGAPQPGYGAPPGGAPGYGAPQGGAPGYGAPQGGAPGYGAPPSSQGHHAPAPATVSGGAPPSSTAQYGTPQIDPQIVGWFQAVDKDRSGHIDETELSQALGMGGNHFSVECSKLMIKMFDKDNSGKIGLNEFQQLHNYIIQMQGGFRHVDRDGSGHLNAQEVQQALSTSGYQLSPQSFDGLFKKFDRKKSGNLGLDGYVELCCFLGTARNVFSAYDVQRSGQVTFGFDQFIYATNMLHS